MGALLSEPVTAMVVERAASECLSAATVTMQGWRRTHEDADIFECSAGGQEESAVFAVLDGHGGNIAAATGSTLLQERLVSLAQKGTPTPGAPTEAALTALSNAFLDADASLRESLPAEDRSGTTVVAAIVTRSSNSKYCVQLAHCGDSRAVVCVGDSLVCSEDHKPSRQSEIDRIHAAGGSVEHGPIGGPLRVDGALAVSRALGDFHFKPTGMHPAKCKVTALPDVQTVECSAGDWVLLACDGVFDVMTNEEVHEHVSSRLRAAAPDMVEGGQVMADLLQLCLDKGSQDNCSACLIQLRADCRPVARSRELREGPWPEAAQEVKTKYAEFFRAHGFEAQANAVQPGGGPAPSQAKGNAGQPRQPAASAEPSPSQSSGQRQIAALAKMLQAIKSTRMIQSAWRASRGNTPNSASSSSGASSSAAAKAKAGK